MNPLDRLPRALLLVAAAGLTTGCNTGLDPRRFERLHYGIPATEVPALLEAEPEPDLRFFVEEGEDRVREWCVDLYRTCYPHPDYRLVYEAGSLVSVLVVQPSGSPSSLDRRVWTSRQLREAAEASMRARVPLVWSELETIDAAARSENGMHPTAYAIGLAIVFPFAVPLLLLYPLMIPFEGMFGDARAIRERAVAMLSELPYGTPAHEVADAMGAPDAHEVGEGGVERWFWEMRDGKSVTFGLAAGFEHGRLLWIDFRPGALTSDHFGHLTGS